MMGIRGGATSTLLLRFFFRLPQKYSDRSAGTGVRWVDPSAFNLTIPNTTLVAGEEVLLEVSVRCTFVNREIVIDNAMMVRK